MCRTSSYPPVVNISNFCEIDVEDDEVNLKKLVGTVGPVAAVITATDAFFNYGKGVFYDPTCISDAFDHAIVRFVKILYYLDSLKILFRSSSVTELIESTETIGSSEILGVTMIMNVRKTSIAQSLFLLGESWGQQGYALIARNRNNTACGLAKYAMYPDKC